MKAAVWMAADMFTGMLSQTFEWQLIILWVSTIGINLNRILFKGRKEKDNNNLILLIILYFDKQTAKLNIYFLQSIWYIILNRPS